MSQMVVITTSDPDTGESVRDVFEVTPPPEPGRERTVLGELVTGIHPGASEHSWSEGVATFVDGRRRITAEFAAQGGAPSVGDAQATLFDV